jgi:hypothetical protein
MISLSFEELIRSHIPLSKRPNGRGWWGVVCKVCGDHGKKGKRAGFKFEPDSTGYNCFNCGHSAIYHHNSAHFSKEMTTVLDAFDIPTSERNKVLYRALTESAGETHPAKRSNINPTPIALPSYFTPLDGDSGDDVDMYACEYLLNDRKIDWHDTKFFIGRKHADPHSKKWFARLILPVYKDNQLIFYTGRDLTETRPKKYLNPDISRENVLYGFDKLFVDTEDPLYVVEGWFDAYHANGVAVFGNKMTVNQIAWLNRSHRPKVIIPDKFGDGYLLGEQALEHGWSISTPDTGDCKDVNDSVNKYGTVYTMMTIKKNTYSGFEGQVRLQSYCK